MQGKKEHRESHISMNASPGQDLVHWRRDRKALSSWLLHRRKKAGKHQWSSLRSTTGTGALSHLRRNKVNNGRGRHQWALTRPPRPIFQSKSEPAMPCSLYPSYLCHWSSSRCQRSSSSPHISVTYFNTFSSHFKNKNFVLPSPFQFPRYLIVFSEISKIIANQPALAPFSPFVLCSDFATLDNPKHIAFLSCLSSWLLLPYVFFSLLPFVTKSSS